MELIVRPLKISVPKTPRGSSVHFLEGFLDTEASYTELLDQTVGQSSFIIAVSTDRRAIGFEDRPKDNLQGCT